MLRCRSFAIDCLPRATFFITVLANREADKLRRFLLFAQPPNIKKYPSTAFQAECARITVNNNKGQSLAQCGQTASHHSDDLVTDFFTGGGFSDVSGIDRNVIKETIFG